MRQASAGDTVACEPTLLVGSREGDVALVDARAGRVRWRRHTGRELGTLVNTGEAIYLTTTYPHAALRRYIHLQETQPAPDTAAEREQQRLEAQFVAPAQLQACRAGDGRALWSFAGWGLAWQTHVEASARDPDADSKSAAGNDGVIVAAGSAQFGANDPHIYALDARSGALRWRVESGSAIGYLDRLIAVRGDRVYVHLGDDWRHLYALDARTGHVVWKLRQRGGSTVFSPGGALLAEVAPGYPNTGAITLLRASDGAELGQAALPDGRVAALTDAGVVYTRSSDTMGNPWIGALDAHEGKELWRTQGIAADRLVVDGALLCYIRLQSPERIAEVGALDAATGQPLWRWRTPGNLQELLRLWGLRHLPLTLAVGAGRSVATIAWILRQPNRRDRQAALPRRPFWVQLRRPLGDSRCGRLRREMEHGQWRYPWRLHSANNACWLAMRWGTVFVGSWLGLIALRASDGRLLWHALPTTDLSFIEPALAP